MSPPGRRGPRAGLTSVERVRIGLLAADQALRTVARRVTRWSAEVPEEHQGPALRLRAALEMARSDLGQAVAAASALRAAGFKPAPPAADELPVFKIGQRVRITGATARRYEFLGPEALAALFVRALHPHGMVSVEICPGNGSEPLGLLHSSLLEAVPE